MTVFVYVNAGKQGGDVDHIKVFANVDAAEKWFEENDPESVVFEYPVLEGPPQGRQATEAALWVVNMSKSKLTTEELCTEINEAGDLGEPSQAHLHVAEAKRRVR